MRQRNFFIGLLFAVLTFATLTAVFGWRHHRWHHHWRSDACYESREDVRNDTDSRRSQPPDENNSNDKQQE